MHTAIICASGPSLTHDDSLTAINTGFPVIAVNSSWRAVPGCSHIYAGDLRWWDTRPGTLGYDVNPAGIAWLNERGAFADLYASQWRALTMWDVLEHIDEPELAVQQASEYVFVSIPIFTDAGDILRSHHFRKNEHIWYFTDDGIKRWFAEQGFECVEHNNIECELGRKGVGTYAFRRT